MGIESVLTYSKNERRSNPQNNKGMGPTIEEKKGKTFLATFSSVKETYLTTLSSLKTNCRQEISTNFYNDFFQCKSDLSHYHS